MSSVQETKDTVPPVEVKVEEKGEKTKKKTKGEAQFKSDKTASALNVTPHGHRKDLAHAMQENYTPAEVEMAWDAWWDQAGLYRADSKSAAEKFVIVIPPPNVTGTLHLGHALTVSIQDAIVRWHRMCGKNVLWVPGTDHAGIATQVVVEKKIMKEQGLTRWDLGREKFLEEVWKWKSSSGTRICSQIRRLGASVDWSRERFTMDEMCSEAVLEAFLRMHSSGLIYRANRLVNWSCALRTAISSIEVEHVELKEPTMIRVPGYKEPIEFGVIHKFAYKLEGSEEEIVVATTRIETMLGDVAVAVNSADPRYQHMIGKKLKHPFIEGREMTVIADDVLAKMEFGTGAVKVTPAHDPNDFECGQRNKLTQINIFDDDGLINENGGKFNGLKRYDVRNQIIEELKTLGLYRGKEKNPMSLGLCSRSKDVVEPVLRPQWWVNCKGMAEQACAAVREGRLQILPSFHEQTWFHFLENIQDWCISRQLWWGHRIPAYRISFPGMVTSSVDSDEKYWVVARSAEEAAQLAAARFPDVPADQLTLKQDEDVLDTWFSSGLFPFSVMGWPKETEDLRAFYPGDLLETGHDILFFWVARMVMMGLQLTGKLPFNKVYLHALVRDKFGRKMSKSLGNVIDPLDVIEGISLQSLHDKLRTGNLDPREVKVAEEGQKRDFPDGIAECGADALRFGLLAYTLQGRDINLDIQKVVALREFCNKPWNATRLALRHFPQGYSKPATEAVNALVQSTQMFADRWILSRLADAVNLLEHHMSNYEFAECTRVVYAFWKYDLCDNYLELIKPVMRLEPTSPENQAKRDAACAVLFTCLEWGLRLMHPFMPFLSEELYHRLPGHVAGPEGDRASCNSIMVQPYPRPHDLPSWWRDSKIESRMALMQEIAHSSRSTRAKLNLTKQRLDTWVVCANPEDYEALKDVPNEIGVLAFAAKVEVIPAEAVATAVAAGCTTSPVNAKLELHMLLNGVVDLGGEVIKMEKSQRTLEQTIANLKTVMSGSNYARASEEVKRSNIEKLASSEEQLQKTIASVERFKALMGPAQIQSYLKDKVKDLQTELAKAVKNLGKLKPSDPTKKINEKTAKQIEAAEEGIRELEAEIKAVQSSITA